MSGTPKEVRAAESQAIARAHRRGQDKEITIVRFIIRNTIELSTFVTVYGDEDVPKEASGTISLSFPLPPLVERTPCTLFHLDLRPGSSFLIFVLASQEVVKATSKPMLIKSNSVSTMVTTSPLKRQKSVIDFIDENSGI